MNKETKLSHEEIEKALLDIFDGDKAQVDELMKAKEVEKSDDKESDDETDDEDQASENSTEDEDEDMEKAYNKMKGELDNMSKAFEEKKKAFEEMKSKVKSKKSKETSPTEVEKADREDLIKSFSATITDTFENRFSKIEKSTKEELEDLRKSITETFEEMKESILQIGNQPMGRRSVAKEADILSKSETNEKDKNERSLSDKNFIEKALDNLIEKSEGGLQTAYQNALINLNAGGVMPNESILTDIQKSENVTFVK